MQSMPKLNKYEYETSPRKLEPGHIPKRKAKAAKKSSKETQRTRIYDEPSESQKAKSVRRKQAATITYIIIGFAILFAISYRNSQIDQDFSKVQTLKQQLSDVQKQNDQLQVSIESSTNLSNLEQEAKEELGMQKLNSSQAVYVTLPKTDYIEPATEQVVIQDKPNIFTSIIDWTLNIFK